ncbi:MAG TPA: PAS domain S-box protein, partial [Geminicoccaceae bacterium]|nr:PAS domain S-box protein [Geminicoccaceae bacterium]
MASRRSHGLARRYAWLFALAALPLVLLVIGLAAVQFQSQREAFLQDLARSTEERRLALDAVFKAANDHVLQLKRAAEDELSGTLPPMVSPLRLHLAPRRDGEAPGVVAGVYLDAAADAAWRERAGNLLGVPDLLERRGRDPREIDMALGLMEKMRLAHLATPFLRWSYYFSASRDFIAIFPFVESRELIGGAGGTPLRSFVDSWLAYDIFLDGTPARNPDRRDYWTSVYLDAGGAGWMVSHGAPVWVQDRFYGIVGTDILLEFLDRFLERTPVPLARTWIVNDRGEVLATGTGELPAAEDVPLLADRLPRELAALPMAELLAASSGFRPAAGYYLRAQRLDGVPWTMLAAVSSRDVERAILPRFLPYLIIVLALALTVGLGQWLLQRLFVAPAMALGDHIRAESAAAGGSGAAAPPPPALPRMWRPLVAAVSAAFAARRELATLNARFVAATEAFPDGLAIFDADDRLVFFNSRYPEHLTANLRSVITLGKRFEDWIREGLEIGPIYHPSMGADFPERRFRMRQKPESEHEHHLIDGRWMRLRESRMAAGGRVLLTTDITARKAAEQALAQSEARFLAAAEALPDGLAIFDAEDRVVYHNSRYPAYLMPNMRAVFRLGRRLREMLEEALEAGPVYHPDMGEDFLERRFRLRSQEASDHEQHLADGRWLRIRENRMPDGGRVVLSADVTELRRSERERAMLAQAVEQAADSVEITTPDYRLTYVNPAFTRLTGWPREEALGRTPGVLLRSGVHDAAFYQDIDTRVRRGEVWSGRLVSRHKDGHLLYQDAVISPVFDEQGRLAHFVAVKRDISEREQAAAALRASEERYRAVVEAQTEFILRLTPDGVLTFVNDAYCRYRGLDRERLLAGFDDVAHYAPEDQAIIRAAWASLTRERPTTSYQTRKLQPDGTVGFEQWTDTALFDEHGAIVEIQSVGRDITEQRRAEEALRASEARFRAVVQDQTELIGRFDADFRLTFANEAQCRIFGRSMDDLLGEDFFSSVPEHVREGLRARMLALTPEDPVVYGENEKVLPTGEVRWFAWTNRALFDEAGRRIGYQSVGRDISEQKRAEQALRDSEARLVQFMQNAPVGMYVKDLDGRYAMANPEMAKVFGRPVEEVLGHPAEAVLPPAEAAMVREYDRELLQKGVPTVTEEYLEGLDAYSWSMVIRFPIRDAAGRIVQIGGFDVDITPQKRVEQRLKESEARFRLIAEGVPVTVVITRFDAPEVLFANARHVETFGAFEGPEPERIASSWERLEDRAALFARVGREGRVDGFETELHRADGQRFSALISARAMHYDGKPAVLMAVTDISDQRRMEQQVRESEGRLAAFLRNAPVAMYLKDLAGRYVLANREMSKVFARPAEEMIGRTAADTAVAHDLELVNQCDEQVLRTGQPVIVEEHAPALEEYRWSMVIRFPMRGESGAITHIGGFHVDITRQKQAEDEIRRQREALYQSEKMAALGSLLAGVAHELNNPLSVVVGYSAMLEELAPDEGSRKRAERVHAAAERCARIVRTFLAMARQKPPQRGPVAINGVIQAALELAAYGLRTAGVAVVRELAAELPPAWGDADQLHQVFTNLIINAQHALEQREPPRRLTLRSRLIGHEVEVTVEDNGPGIEEEVVQRIFEPFFTTKPQGVGTGVGLSLCHGIVTAHDGTIAVATSPGAGARFTVRLPLATEATTTAVPAARTLPAPVRAGRVLVVDDEPEIADLVAEALGRDGIEVVVAGSGRQALARLEEGGFDLVISDLKMPDIDGPTLWRELRQRDPAAAERFLFVTGDTLGVEVNRFLRETAVEVMGKPLDLEE